VSYKDQKKEKIKTCKRTIGKKTKCSTKIKKSLKRVNAPFEQKILSYQKVIKSFIQTLDSKFIESRESKGLVVAQQTQSP